MIFPKDAEGGLCGVALMFAKRRIPQMVAEGTGFFVADAPQNDTKFITSKYCGMVSPFFLKTNVPDAVMLRVDQGIDPTGGR